MRNALRLKLLAAMAAMSAAAATTATFLSCTPAFAAEPGLGAEPGLVAHYDFDEGSGTVLHDSSGNGNDGTIHGAQYQKNGKGYCLKFNGINNFVDCGNGPSLNLQDAMTLEAWVYQDSRSKGEPGILGKHFESYLLSSYSDGQCYWYVSGGGNNARALMPLDSWHQIVGTFDGKKVDLYIDGKLAQSSPSKFDKIKAGKNFFIGCVVGDAAAIDPFYTKTSYFPGMLDEVKVYNRALSAGEIGQAFNDGLKNQGLTAAYAPAGDGPTAKSGKLSIRADRYGRVQIEAPGSPCVVESAFSYPGERIDWNNLGNPATGAKGWKPVARKLSATSLQIEAQNAWYTLRRTVTVRGDKVQFEDRFTNSGTQPVGIIARNSVTGPESYLDAFSPGGAETPVIYLQGRNGCVGITAEDDISRLRFMPGIGIPNNQGRLRIGDWMLEPGKSYTMRWSVYALPANATFLSFIDQLRREWKANNPILGPFSFFDISSPLLDNPEQLKAYLKRRKLGVIALSPWLDYDPGSFDRVWTRDGYKMRMKKAIAALRAADPTIKLLGSIETDWVTLDTSKIPNGDKLPTYTTGSGQLNAAQTRIVDEANLPWKDSVKRTVEGNVTLELYSRGGKPQTALSVYPAVGNYQYKFLMDQVKFLLHEVGTDGFYIDEFSQSWAGGIPSYSGWDGISAELDGSTGQILRKYTDCGYAGIQARVNLMKYAFDRGKVVVCNTYPSSQAEQSLPSNRFAETWGSFDPFAVPDGQKPPLQPALFRSSLSSLIGLGIVGQPEKHNTAQRTMHAVLTYLRHAMVYYHYAIEDIPENGPGSGEYGPINHMFPITPIALHEGWIEGKERTLTCLSGQYTRTGKKPTVHVFDLNGREVPVRANITGSANRWNVDLTLRDWAEIAVIE